MGSIVLGKVPMIMYSRANWTLTVLLFVSQCLVAWTMKFEDEMFLGILYLGILSDSDAHAGWRYVLLYPLLQFLLLVPTRWNQSFSKHYLKVAVTYSLIGWAWVVFMVSPSRGFTFVTSLPYLMALISTSVVIFRRHQSTGAN